MRNEGDVLDHEAVVDCIVRECARLEACGTRCGCEPYVAPTAGVADPGKLAARRSGHDVGGKRGAEDLLDGKAGRVCWSLPRGHRIGARDSDTEAQASPTR
jgi:hypothetical protein